MGRTSGSWSRAMSTDIPTSPGMTATIARTGPLVHGDTHPDGIGGARPYRSGYLAVGAGGVNVDLRQYALRPAHVHHRSQTPGNSRVLTCSRRRPTQRYTVTHGKAEGWEAADAKLVLRFSFQRVLAETQAGWPFLMSSIKVFEQGEPRRRILEVSLRRAFSGGTTGPARRREHRASNAG